jgi:hypothetical protein
VRLRASRTVGSGGEIAYKHSLVADELLHATGHACELFGRVSVVFLLPWRRTRGQGCRRLQDSLPITGEMAPGLGGQLRRAEIEGARQTPNPRPEPWQTTDCGKTTTATPTTYPLPHFTSAVDLALPVQQIPILQLDTASQLCLR